MKLLRFLWRTLGQLPRAIAQTGAQRKLRRARSVDEAERLDRIRNPSKYRGK